MAYQRYQKPRRVPKNCEYCASKTQPDFKEVQKMNRYLTERGKIMPHTQTGICSKHQRQMMMVIKQARYLGLLPFLNRA